MRRPLALLALALLAAAGCRGPLFHSPPPPRISVHTSPALARSGRVRVLVLPFRHEDDRVSRSVTEAFVLELEKCQLFEVVSPYGPAGDFLNKIPVWDNGGLDVRSLVSLRARFDVEGLVLGRVTQHRPYDPPVLGLRVQIVSTRTGAVLWGAAACFDAREDGVRALMQSFYYRRLDTTCRSYGWRVLSDSPRYYAQFVSHELVATLDKAAKPVVASQPK